MSHLSQFKPQLSHFQYTRGQPVKSSKVKTRTPVSVGSKFKHLHGLAGKADSAADHFQLPAKENLVPVDDTVIYEPPTPKLSLNPRKKLMSRGNHDQSPAMILSHSLEWSDTRLKRQVPDFPALRMQHDNYLPSYLFDDPTADMPAYSCCNQVPRHVQVPYFTPSFPLSYQQNLNPNMGELFPGCASGGNPIGFSRLSEMELRLKQLMTHRRQSSLSKRLEREVLIQVLGCEVAYDSWGVVGILYGLHADGPTPLIPLVYVVFSGKKCNIDRNSQK